MCDYSYCESAHAGPDSPWHIRRLDAAGRKMSGGITTNSMCGRIAKGWDLRSPVSPAHDSHTCRECLEEYRAMSEVSRG